WGAHGGGVFQVAFTHDGRIVSAGRDNTGKSWTGDGAAIKASPGMPDVALKCSFTHDGKRVVGGDWLGNVRVWDATEAKDVFTLAANPVTLVIQVDAAKADLAAKQAAATAAANELAAAVKVVAEKDAALKASSDKHAAAVAAAGKNEAHRVAGA